MPRIPEPVTVWTRRVQSRGNRRVLSFSLSLSCRLTWGPQETYLWKTILWRTSLVKAKQIDPHQFVGLCRRETQKGNQLRGDFKRHEKLPAPAFNSCWLGSKRNQKELHSFWGRPTLVGCLAPKNQPSLGLSQNRPPPPPLFGCFLLVSLH